MTQRMADGSAHSDAMLLLTSSVEQVRAMAQGREWDHDLFVAQAEVIAQGQDVEALARCAATALDLASLSATLIMALAEGLNYDVDGLLAGMALLRPPFGEPG